MDGNGRWARQRSLPRVAGHKAGVPSVRATVETCARLGVGALTLYAFSVENWKRPRLEVDTLWRLLRVYLRVGAGPDDAPRYPLHAPSDGWTRCRRTCERSWTT